MKKQTKLGLVLAAAAVISVSVASLVSARGWVQNGADWYYVDNSGEYVTESIQSSGNSKFYLGEDGTMQRDYFLEEYNNNAYYFGQNGAMVTNTWVAIESSRVENQEDYIPDNYWYYFQASGKAMKAASGGTKKTTIDGKKYAFNEYGQMLTGWISEGKVVGDDEENPFAEATYYAGGDNDGVLRSGWLTYYDGYDGDDYQSEYTNLYFYFNPSNNQKVDNKVKKINGRSYAFDQYGIMNSGWDVYDYQTSLNDNRVSYFSGEDDGHQVKKGWVFAVPAADLDCKAYGDDEEKYMYFNSSGEILRDQYKRINGKYYVFNRSGIMETGLVLWVPEGFTINGTGTETYRFLDTLDMDWQTGEDLAKKGLLRFGSDGDQYFFVNAYGQVDTSTRTSGGTGAGTTQKVSNFSDLPIAGDQALQVKIHNYGSDGARKTGANNVEFADETYVFNTNSNGDKGSGIFAKKYYSLGIQLKASSDIKYGIYNNASPSLTLQNKFGEPLTAQAYKENGVVNDAAYRNALRETNYIVLNTGGSIVKGNASAKKDADGNYWLIDPSGNTLRGIYTVNVKSQGSVSNGLKTRTVAPAAGDVQTLSDNRYRNGHTTAYTIASLSNGWNGLGITDDTLKLWFNKEAMNAANFGITGYDKGNSAAMTAAKWRIYESGNQYYLQLEGGLGKVFCYQSDINDLSNKWIPYGVLDNSRKSVVNDPGHTGNYPEGYYKYEVTPTNDYFLNCYWID